MLSCVFMLKAPLWVGLNLSFYEHVYLIHQNEASNCLIIASQVFVLGGTPSTFEC